MEFLGAIVIFYIVFKLLGLGGKSWRSDPATKKQISYLRSLGVSFDRNGLTKGDASDLITGATEGCESSAVSRPTTTISAQDFGYLLGRMMRNKTFWFILMCVVWVVFIAYSAKS